MKRPARKSQPVQRGKGVFRIVEFQNPSQEIAFRVAGWTQNGERVRQNFKTHEEAVARKQVLETQSANLQTAGRPVFTRLRPDQVADAEGAVDMLEKAGHKSLREAAEFFVRNWRDPLKRVKTSAAVKTFLAEKTAANRRASHLRSLRLDLDTLSMEFGDKWIHEVTKGDLLTLIESADRSPRTQNHIRDRLHNFLGWCVKNGYAPVNVAALIEKKSVEAGEISVLTNQQVSELLRGARRFKAGKLVPYVALATFCAIRPDELSRLTWEQIDLAEKQITITASAAKKRGRRVVDIPENCVAWLRPFAKEKKPIKTANWRNDFDAVKELAKFGTPAAADASEDEKRKRAGFVAWPQDVLRHTGISCHYRRHNDEGLTAAWAGNSPDMIHTHYRALVSAKDAAAFFEIKPVAAKPKAGKAKRKVDEPKNVVPMPQAA